MRDRRFSAKDLPPIDRPYTQENVADAVGAMAAGIEIVDDRYVDYKSLDTPTLIADDFFDAGCVIGTPTSRLARDRYSRASRLHAN